MAHCSPRSSNVLLSDWTARWLRPDCCASFPLERYAVLDRNLCGAFIIGHTNGAYALRTWARPVRVDTLILYALLGILGVQDAGLHVNCIMNSSLAQTRLQEFVARALAAVENVVFEPSSSPQSQPRTPGSAASKPPATSPPKLFVTSGSHSALLKILADQESCVLMGQFHSSVWAPATPASNSVVSLSLLRTSNDIIRAAHVKDAPSGPARLSTACTSTSLQTSEACVPSRAHDASSAHRHAAQYTLQKSFMFACMDNTDAPLVSDSRKTPRKTRLSRLAL